MIFREIERVIPAPRAASTKPRVPKYDFAPLLEDTKQCALTETSVETWTKDRSRMQAAIAGWRRQNNSTAGFIIRQVDVEGKPFLGIWASGKEFKPRGPRK